jgi:hypothetical protein
VEVTEEELGDALPPARAAPVTGSGSEEDPVDLDKLDEASGTVFGMWSISHMQMVLALQPDFKAQKSRLHDVVEARGHQVLFLPKFHCELNFIEMYWATTKMMTRRRETFTWPSLLESMFYAFGQLDSLQHPDADSQYPLKPGALCPLHSIFFQRVSRKTRELWALYGKHPDLDGCEVAELRRLQKLRRQHLVPSRAGTVFDSAPLVTVE